MLEFPAGEINICLISTDVPDAPGKPVVEDITPEGASLTWTPPPKDGGAPITEYKVQKRKRGDTKWDDVITPEPITDCMCKVRVCYFC